MIAARSTACCQNALANWVERSDQLSSLMDGSKGVSGTIALARGEEIISWIEGDVVELVAFAIHVELPIYVRNMDEPDAPTGTLPKERDISPQRLRRRPFSHSRIRHENEARSSRPRTQEPRRRPDGWADRWALQSRTRHTPLSRAPTIYSQYHNANPTQRSKSCGGK